MSEADVQAIHELLKRCTPEEEREVFLGLRKRHTIHELETLMGASAETILEALHRASELTRWMLRGVIADAAFRTNVVPRLADHGWEDDTPEGNFAFDYRLRDRLGPITVQVKLQRSNRFGVPVVASGEPYDMGEQVHVVETQKTRTGNEGGAKTRPYKYGEFDVLAVSMQPYTKRWDTFKFTLGRWLLAEGESNQEIAKKQPVAMKPSEFWTEDFNEAASWFHSEDHGKRITKRKAARRSAAKKRAR